METILEPMETILESESIVIHPAKVRGGNKFDTSRVKIKWRWDLYVRASDAEWEKMTDEERELALKEGQAQLDEMADLEAAGTA